MKIDDFLARLEKVEAHGTDCWTACCPAHADASPSLSVSAKDGRILVHCHAGCTAADIVQSMGLGMRDLFQDASGRVLPDASDGAGERALRTPKPSARKSPGVWVCDYVYHDADGTVVYKQSRYVRKDGGKTFVLRHPDPRKPGGWGFGLKSIGRNRVVYHLPEVLAAAKAGRTLVVCEGEKDVDNLRALGFAATCNVCGAGNWGVDFPDGWGAWFSGLKGVLIVADDDPAEKTVEKRGRKAVVPFLVGQRHALDVARQLVASGFGGAVRIITMPDVAGRHVKDFTEWQEARRAEGLPVDSASFRDAVDEAVRRGWADPDGWAAHYKLRPAGGASAEKGGRAADSAPSAQGGAATECGRFGRISPRTPIPGVRTYEVDFKTAFRRHVRLALNRESFRIDREDMDDDVEGWRRMPLPSMVGAALWMVQEKIGDVKMGAGMRSDAIGIVCLMWLRSRGRFFWDDGAKGFATSLFFDEVTGVLMRVRSDEFMAFVATAAELNRESSVFKYLMSLVDDAALSPDASRGVVPSSMWDRRGDAVYLSSGDSEMYRLKGGRVDRVQNGTDGVLFMRGRTLAPWTLRAGGGVDPFAEADVFRLASWCDVAGCMNVRIWTLNLFACHQTKPILLLTGRAQSGKTRMAKAIKEILGVRQDGRMDLSVQQAEDGDKGLDAFWATVNDGKLEVFDNLDTKIKWVGDALQNAATDGQTKRRTLYTTFGVSILRANAHLIVTSNNPLFSTEGAGGMADRLVTVNLLARTGLTMDRGLSDDIASRRDDFMTWIARTVAAALADAAPVDESVNRRHPDYGAFAVRCGRAFGDEAGVVSALGAAEAEKALLPLRNDPVAKEVLAALAGAGGVLRFTGGQMSERIIAAMEDPDERTRALYSSRKVGKAMSKFERQFGTIFRMRPPRLLDGRTTYESDGFTALGALQVGQVDLQRRSAEKRGDARNARGFPETAPTNPLDPLDTRADASTLFSSREKGEEEKGIFKLEAPDDDGLGF